MQLVPITQVNLPTMWPKIAPHVDGLAEISGGRLTTIDIVTAVLKAQMQLWAAVDGDDVSLMLTEILVHPTGHKDAHIISATGKNADRWIDLWSSFEPWARSEGCSVVTATCRLGWRKLLGPLGFKEHAIVLEKHL